MAVTIDNSVQLTPQEARALADFRAKLGASEPEITTPDGRPAPRQLQEILNDVLSAIAGGCAISIAEMPGQITTTTAATLLEVSRPTIMKYIKQGKLEATMVGSHHRLDTKQVLALADSKKQAIRESVFKIMDAEDQ
ncbi:helix-turn-helix domain-containing protein [Corynebacterium sp.]|uniref:helix-turn-helix domain-containing protein n=1 Tax=Corynebacterium sp. TaxID=1720 RepID=UPI002608540D|nr:helix-turn-helix domain-containing protein [Corynebacterium sp.]